MKHAEAETVTVRIAADAGRLHLEVEDRGRGFQPDLTKDSGLRGLSDRVEALGGTLLVHSAPGFGTRLTAMVPISGESND